MGRTIIISSLFLASNPHSSLSPASSLKCLRMLMGTVVLSDSLPDVASDRVVSSPIYFTFSWVNDVDVVYKFTYNYHLVYLLYYP